MRGVVAAASVAVFLTAATLALAQEPPPAPTVAVPTEPGQTCADATGQTTGCDNEFTAIAKDGSELWQQVGGAKFGEGGDLATGSYTPYTVDLYAVDFLDQRHGFAGGAACPEDTPFDELDSCTRVPVIWAYTDRDGEGPLWKEVYRGDEQGFVGAISYFAKDRALAVGGTGRYPYREFSNDSTSDPDSDPSGRGAAWDLSMSSSGEPRWRPYEADELPAAPNLRPRTPGPTEIAADPQSISGERYMAPMRALTALDCRHSVAVPDRCVAGGLQQIFMWQDGGFTKAYGNGSPDYDCVNPPVATRCETVQVGTAGQKVDLTPRKPETEVSRAADLRFRIRSLRFAPGDNPEPSIIGVTAGCCDPNPHNNAARQIAFQENTRWLVRPLFRDAAETERLRQTIPDSWYAVDVYKGNLSAIASQGGPAEQPEPASVVTGGTASGSDYGNVLNGAIGDALSPALGQSSSGSTHLAIEATRPTLSGVRLVAGEGDAGGPTATIGVSAQNSGQPDSYIDWAVGELLSSGQGAAYTTLTTPHGAHAQSPLDCPDNATPPSDPAKCQPATPDEFTARTKSSAFQLLDSYRLNGFSTVASTGTAWAVGDRGAIERFGGSGAAQVGAEPKPPRLGSHTFSDDRGLSDYSGAEPSSLTDDPGSVPTLHSRTETRSTPELVQTGSPSVVRSASLSWDDAATIITSRDGGEAWALGSGQYAGKPGRLTLWHFDGAGWAACDADGIEGQVEADPACSELSPLQHYTDSFRRFAPVQITAAARVPLEYDSDPTNDDEFEIVALGTAYTPPGTTKELLSVLRYRDGRWSVDSQAMAEMNLTGLPVKELAFSSPSDGWAVNAYGRFLHFDGEHWASCEGSPAAKLACGDDPEAPRLPVPSSSVPEDLHLATAGRRVYMYGGRPANATGVGLVASTAFPMAIYKDPEGQWTDGSGADENGGGLDPGCASHDSGTHNCVAADGAGFGLIGALSVALDGDGGLDGWAVRTDKSGNFLDDAVPVRNALLRLSRGDGGDYSWDPWTAGDAVADHAAEIGGDFFGPAKLLTLPGSDGPGPAFLAPTTTSAFNSDGPLFFFDPDQERWRAFPTPFLATDNPAQGYAPEGKLRHIASDGRGGAWIAVRRMGGESGFSKRFKQGATFFYRYTKEVPGEVFSDVPNPASAQNQVITDTAAGGDGSLWLSTKTGSVYRYDRVTGWDRMDIPGWDPGRVVTRPSGANAIAIGPDGTGVVAGEGGRIANVTPSGVVLDAVAGVACSATQSSCGTGRDLLAAAVSPGGSALVGGEARALLWRGSDGDFQPATSPPANLTAAITSISMPSDNSAWLTTDTGQVFAGTGAGASWDWHLENVSADEAVLSTGTEGANGTSGEDVPLDAIAVNSAGQGFAVGEQGLVLQRTGNGAHPWKRLGELPLTDYKSVALPPGGGLDGALIGGEYGLILTLDDGRLEVAHQDDPWDPVNATNLDTGPSHVVGLELVPGSGSGQLEAWAAEQAPAESTDRRGAALGTNRSPAPNALLHFSSDPSEPLLDAGVGRVEPLIDSPEPGPGDVVLGAFGKSDCEPLKDGPCPAPMGARVFNEEVAQGVVDRFTGADAPDLAIFTGDAVDAAGTGDELDPAQHRATLPSHPTDRSVVHRRWIESVADRFSDAGVPLIGAIGGRDLSRTAEGQPGSPIPWEKAMAEMPEPWGRGGTLPGRNGLSFEPVGGTGLTGSGPEPGQASTHYALDITRDGEKLVRVVVVDTSLKSLTAGDAVQNPVDNQVNWLRSVLCRPGDASAAGATCTRGPNQRAVVVSEAPTYSYGPAATETLLAGDSASLEALLFEYDVSLVISGRLGWNGLYYTLDSGLHSPQPGGGYPAEPPAPVRPDGHTIVNVVSSGAGGTFAREGQGLGAASARDGFWHGYSEVHLDPETGAVSVEQRPLFDWIQLQADSHSVRAGKRLELNAVGREPPGTDQAVRYDEIGTAAITHRFELLEADPAKPWLPLLDSDSSSERRSPASERLGEEDPCGPYICLDPAVGTIDDQTGQVKAGTGSKGKTFAVAHLSVAEQTATFPLVFQPRASFKLAREAPAPPAVVPPPASPPAPVAPSTPTVNAPPPPVLPIATASALPPPPAPPIPPTVESQAPLDLSLSPSSLDISPPTAVSQPPTPPVNPAPPGGARKEARQRQAAAQKSGADSAEEGAESEERGGDLAEGPPIPPGSQMTRYEFTAVADRQQPSAWARDALLAGGLGIAALILALGLNGVRPTPRRREPELPAPAWSRAQGRGRR